MKFLMVVFLMSITLQGIPGCGAGKGEKAAKEAATSAEATSGDLQKIYVEAAESAATAMTGEEVVVTVSGNLPSPAYKLERVDVQLKGNVVEITPLARYDRSVIAAQVLVPFSEPVKVKVPKAGEYVIRLVGRGESRESKITVK